MDVVPLSNIEESAYANLDSTASLEKSFQPTGFLAKFVTMDEEDERQETTKDSSYFGQAWSRVNSRSGSKTSYEYNKVKIQHKFLDSKSSLLD